MNSSSGFPHRKCLKRIRNTMDVFIGMAAPPAKLAKTSSLLTGGKVGPRLQASHVVPKIPRSCLIERWSTFPFLERLWKI